MQKKQTGSNMLHTLREQSTALNAAMLFGKYNKNFSKIDHGPVK